MKIEPIRFAYFRCPRCELNYILPEEGYCVVCKAEMRIPGYTLFEDDETYISYDEYDLAKIDLE